LTHGIHGKHGKLPRGAFSSVNRRAPMRQELASPTFFSVFFRVFRGSNSFFLHRMKFCAGGIALCANFATLARDKRFCEQSLCLGPGLW
jgi:hypothetical protein